MTNVFQKSNLNSIRNVATGDESKKEMGVIISQICFTQSNKVLFAAVSDDQKSQGSIRCFKTPLTTQFVEYTAHDDQGIEKMRVSFDDQFLVTAGRDGSIIVFDIKVKITKFKSISSF